MTINKMCWSLIITIALNSFVFALTNEWQNTVLDPYGKYHLYWQNDDINKLITFRIEVQTRGWVGFGISPNGGMKNSDLVIGWVSDTDAKTFFHDRFADEESLPEIDESQDWHLMEAKQNSSHTIMKFFRYHSTCDKRFDRDITADTNRIIYAYSDSDPESMDVIMKHPLHCRGSKNILLLTHSKLNEPEEKDLKSLIVNVNNIMIPSKETTYWCKAIKLANIKRHVVKFEKHVTERNEPFVHHISLFACIHPNVNQLEKYLNIEGIDCTNASYIPKDLIYCFNPLFHWSVGGESVNLPKEAGFPIGADEETIYMLLRLHYDNPELVNNRMDSSGLKFYYTQTLRRYDAYVMTLGSTIDFRLLIPPKMNQIKTIGHCDPRCYEKFIDSNGFNAFAVMPLSNTAKSVKTRHFRGNQELEWILNENNYDFNYQPFRSLKDMRKIKSGDLISTECVFNTSSRKNAIIGGLSANDEMCLTLIFYYPRQKNAKPCMSGLSMTTLMTLSSVEEVYEFSPNDEPFIKSPYVLNNRSLSKYLREKQDWDYNLINDSQLLIQYSAKYTQCYAVKTQNDKNFPSFLGYSAVKQIYKPVEYQCHQSENFYIIQMEPKNETSLKWFFIYFSLIFVITLIFITIKYSKSRYNQTRFTARFQLLK